MKEQRWSVSGKERQQQGNERSREKGKTELRLSVEVLQRTRTLGKEKCGGDFALPWIQIQKKIGVLRRQKEINSEPVNEHKWAIMGWLRSRGGKATLLISDSVSSSGQNLGYWFISSSLGEEQRLTSKSLLLMGTISSPVRNIITQK